jgi:hypothetical protein
VARHIRAKDHSVTRKAVDDGYILVTYNTVDFLPLYDQEEVHVGLIRINVAPGLMSLELQKRLFLLALRQLAGEGGMERGSRSLGGSKRHRQDQEIRSTRVATTYETAPQCDPIRH